MGCTKKKQYNLNPSVDSFEFNFENLTETGRLQYFFHSPLSKLPIRDITNEQGRGPKSEPYIEKYAENYCSRCYQSNNIIPFLRSNEKYLFLFTTCKNSSLGDFYNKRFLVGYIVKERKVERHDNEGNFFAVQGETKLYSFSDSYPLSELFDKETIKYIRMRILSKKETGMILKHFEDKTNVLRSCLNDLNRLKKK